jgi:hypothetical protein
MNKSKSSEKNELGRIMREGCKYCGSKIRYESYMYEAEDTTMMKYPLTDYCTTTCCVLDVEETLAKLEAERLQITLAKLDTTREQMIAQSSCLHSAWGHRDGHVVCKLCGWRCPHQTSERGCCTMCGVGLPGGPPKPVEVPIAIDWTKNRRKTKPPAGSVKPHVFHLKAGKTYTLKKGR